MDKIVVIPSARDGNHVCSPYEATTNNFEHPCTFCKKKRGGGTIHRSGVNDKLRKKETDVQIDINISDKH